MTLPVDSYKVIYINTEPCNPILKAIEGITEMSEILTKEKSIYLQIGELIENEILNDILLEENKVPSTTVLAKTYEINPATAAKGINILVSRGILYKKRGIGMFVVPGAKEKIKKDRLNGFSDTYIKKLLIEADNIGITKVELLQMIEELGTKKKD